jgi:hypothetical protein
MKEPQGERKEDLFQSPKLKRSRVFPRTQEEANKKTRKRETLKGSIPFEVLNNFKMRRCTQRKGRAFEVY